MKATQIIPLFVEETDRGFVLPIKQQTKPAESPEPERRVISLKQLDLHVAAR